MAVGDILRLLASATGLSTTDEVQRQQLVDYLNEGAQNVWIEADIDGSLDEDTFDVQDGTTLVLDRKILHIRAMADATIQYNADWTLRDMYYRYQDGKQFSSLWFNWRDRGFSPVIKQPTGPLHYVVGGVEATNVRVLVSGSQTLSDFLTEEVLMDAVAKDGTITFTEIKNLRKSITSVYNVTITDPAADDAVIAVIPNNEIESLYHIVDVSSFPWTQTSITRSMRVLYKKKLPHLAFDNDQFPAPGYDQAVFYRALEAWQIRNNKADIAQLYDDYASRLSGRIHNDKTRGKQETANFGRNPHDNLFYKPYTLRRWNYTSR